MRYNHIILTLLTVFLVSYTLNAQKSSDEAFDNMLDDLLTQSVPYVTVEELKLLDNVVLLDARPEKEYEVSHLEGAECVGFESFKKGKVAHLSPEDTIVVYCSVGYRSEKVGEKLQALGFKNVYNLYGSIFEWVNQGNPVVNTAGKTEEVHTYNKEWSQWLKRGNKVW